MVSPQFATAFAFALCTVLIAPCGMGTPPRAAAGEPTAGNELAAEEQVEAIEHADPPGVQTAVAETPEDSEPEASTPVLRRRELPIVAPITPPVQRHLQSIVARARRDEHVFAKMGGSSVESRAYLHCLARDNGLEMGEHGALRPTLEFFRERRAAGRSPFARESIVAQVGWSLRQGLTGRPSRAIQEVRAINSRWALAFWGGNDVQGRNPRRYVERLIQLIDSLEARGVVPLLASTTPRGDDEVMDRWARRYNIASRGLAEALALPYVDFYAAIDSLPNRGLAGDGVHPNVLLDGGRSRPCDFREDGLQRGQNQRNLRTLQLLDAVRAAIETTPTEQSEAVEAQAQTAPEGHAVEAPFQSRSTAGETPLVHVPHGEVVTTEESRFDSYSCEGSEPSPGPDRLYRVDVTESIALDFDVYRDGGTLAYLGSQPDAQQCVSWARNRLSVVLEPGTHYVVVEVPPESERAPILVVGEPVL